MRNLSPRRRRWMRARITSLAVFLFVSALLVVYRAYDLQFVRADWLRSRAEEQYTRNIRLSPKRGTIRDRHGAELAVSVDVDSVWADPRIVAQSGHTPEEIAEKLATLLDVDRDVIRKRLASRRYFVWIKRRVTPTQAKAVEALELPGVAMLSEAQRFYPNRQLAAHVLGFSDVDGNGIEGLELSLDERLRGDRDSVPAIRDRRGRIVFSRQLLDDRASVGDALTLTLDKTIQHLAEKELELAIKTFEARAGSVVVMDPQTGELLAIANYPTFNPNRPGASPPAHRRNRAVTDRFEPGSTVKPFTVAGALAKGAIRPNQKIDCQEGEMEIAEYTIHDSHKWEKLTPAQILAFSSNIGTAKIGLSLGRPGLYRTLRGFGFGDKSGVELPGETEGILRHHKRWYEMDAATISFGQGMSATALQLTSAMAALANGGKLMRPILVKRISDARGGVLEEALPRVRRRVVPKRVARLVSDMLTGVTGAGGTAEEAAIDGYLVAGKTGTAQKADYIHGGYAKDAWSSSFVGYAPARDPKIVVAVVLDEPVIAHYGGTVAAPVFRRLVEPALRHLGVSPEHDNGSLAGHVRAQRKKAEALVQGDLSQAQADKADDADDAGNRARADSGSKPSLPPAPKGRARVPDLMGLNARAVVQTAHRAALLVSLSGTGFADAQDPKAGMLVDPGAAIRVHLSPRTPPDDKPEEVPTGASPDAHADAAGVTEMRLDGAPLTKANSERRVGAPRTTDG
ncbi:MAG: penicillin-binding protein [Myxococcales bacterium]|nr:penicillin-binding protein [Myxococcales bacterium]